MNDSLEIKIITGQVNSGKTTGLYRRLPETDTAGGILSLPVFRGGRKQAYYAFDILRKEAVLLASELPLHPSFRFRRFYFSEYGFEFARERIRRSFDRQKLIIDEIGLLELEGRGFAPVLKECIDGFSGTLILVVRENLLDTVISVFELNRYGITAAAGTAEGVFA